MRELAPNNNKSLVSIYGRERYRLPKPWAPWFAERNKARFPYLFPSLFPDALKYYEL